jgi:predicted MFS family arabinose efflux permease
LWVRPKLIVAAIAQLAVAACLLVVDDGSASWFLVSIAVVAGVPQGFANVAIQNSLYHQADESRIGSASGLLRTSMYLGAIFAAATTGATFHDGADTAGLRQLAYYMMAAALVFLFITVADRSLKRVGTKS